VCIATVVRCTECRWGTCWQRREEVGPKKGPGLWPCVRHPADSILYSAFPQSLSRPQALGLQPPPMSQIEDTRATLHPTFLCTPKPAVVSQMYREQ